jgi:hypothetical protein
VLIFNTEENNYDLVVPKTIVDGEQKFDIAMKKLFSSFFKSDLSKLRCNDDLQHLQEEQNLSRNSSLAHGDQIGGIELKYKVQNNINVICNNLHS